MSLPGWLSSVHHDGSIEYLSNLYPNMGEQVCLSLRVGADAPVKRILLRTFPDGEQSFSEMTPVRNDAVAQWWEVYLTIAQPVTHYRFVIQAEDGVWHYSAAGSIDHEPLDVFDFRILADYQPPKWIFDSVFYQIFPDRFANGDLSNDPQPGEFEYRGYRPRTFPWGSSPSPDQPMPIVFYGGDLQGILQHLDYLQDLGVNGLYLNPLFSAFSNHKYDVVDYDHVDVHFGGDEALIALREALSERGMHFILDIVPNHAGYWHPWFQAARADSHALEAEFFTFNHHPNDYASWLGVWMLPKLNYRSYELRQRIYAGADAVFRRWLKPPYLADGWRVDVANMLGRQGPTQLGAEIAQNIHQAVKQTNPQAYLIGENFFDATPQLQGDQWDGVMNYAGFMKPLLFWLSGFHQTAHGLQEAITSPRPWPTQALADTWVERLASIPWAIALQQYNLLDSHDTQRVRSALQDNKVLHRLAVLAQFTFPGIPGLYYGDEIGLTDISGLGSRGCMPWDPAAWDHDLLAYYKKLIALRRHSPVLQSGGFQILSVEEDLLAFQRMHLQDRFVVVLQRSPVRKPAGPLPVKQGGIADGSRFREFFTGHETHVQDGHLEVPDLTQGGTLWEQIS